MTISFSGGDDAARAGRFAGGYMVDAAFTQLIGLCRGVLVDGQLADSEIVALDQWLTTYQHILPEWPTQLLAQRVKRVLEDGFVDEEERADLVAFVERASGTEGTERFDAPTSLPLTIPPPHIDYSDGRFCLTGTFLYGPRKKVTAAIEEQGGIVVPYVSRCNFLVIGGTVTPSWKFGTHGLKIEEAVSRRVPPYIITESHWVTSLC